MRTKIIITIGPKSEDKDKLLPLLEAGVDIVRLNFSHATQAQYKKVRRIISDYNKKTENKVGMLLDLQGPRIRVGKMPEGGIILEDGEEYDFVYSKKPYQVGDIIPIDNKDLSLDIKKNDPLFLCNGEIELIVTKVKGRIITGKVMHGGVLTSNKAINVPNTNMRKGGLTTKDIHDLRFGLKAGMEYVGLSFVQTAADVLKLKKELGKNSNVKIVAKIERGIALKNIDRIITASDFIMIARGDLGIETPIEDLPLVQKNLIRHSHWHSRPAIIATQVMTSMILNPVPTRAEVSDIANAVLDGADAIMLSDETSVGDHPLEAIKILRKVIYKTESYVQKAYINF
ncbi:MAG: pyruvate kinase [Patescibacteria group bacterium]|nr:pyruvate kinase [Patescibacteria group bacterium]MDD3778155.1 pyruvate kinase [Patescibacteria group bacterium]MDD4443617.1 pyruvate kinase [Patescibacteria group bacterium]NCU39313.1 pyruvate kinase [Candidatus Falkowbacteria bacterium]